MKNIKSKIIRKGTPGVWVERPRRCEILICSCGNKYLKTREGQTVCIKCINKLKEKEAKKVIK